ncbi:hypothetical protein G6F65_023075 [Rhizopus arrhizus]|nr:hypothetical protein G6F65_023075 [Rhizopus arrhizus]
MKDYVTEPIELVIEKGYVTRINGGLQADILKEYMAAYEDPEAYAVSHIGWGLQPRAQWSLLAHYNKEAHIGMDAPATPPAILTSRCATAASRWMTSLS